MTKYCFILICFTFCLQCKVDPDDLLKQEEFILSKSLKLPQTPFNYSDRNLPVFLEDEFIKIQDNTPQNNISSDAVVTLGRVLFYDKSLSINNKIACASCHVQKFGFSDTAKLSSGFEGGFTKRHSMGLVNSKFYSNGRFFWDERAASLEEQVLAPIQDAVEMGMNIDSLILKLNRIEYYKILFKYAYKDTQIDKVKVSSALAQFVRSIISYRSKYDIGRSKVKKDLDSFPNFSSEENRGKKIFFTTQPISCSGCHNTNAFITDNPRNNGLLNIADEGIKIHTKLEFDYGKFKAPSLKNIAIRPPYMHDGRFENLGEVINHYTGGITYSESLDGHLKMNGKVNPIIIDFEDRQALIRFLETLTDFELLTDERFSNPFK